MNASTRTTPRRARRVLTASFAALSLSLLAPAPARALPVLATTSTFAAVAARAVAGAHGLEPANGETFATGASFASQDCPTARTVQRGGVSLSQATAIAQSRVPGRVVKAETVMSGDRVIHEIRILGNDGRVRTVRVDAQSGAIL